MVCGAKHQVQAGNTGYQYGVWNICFDSLPMPIVLIYIELALLAFKLMHLCFGHVQE